MAFTEDPVVGNWYTNRNGELLRVRLAVYRHDYLSALMLEYLDGQRQIISLGDWYALELHRDMIAISQRHVSN